MADTRVDGNSARYSDADLDRWAGHEDVSTNTAANMLRDAAGMKTTVRLGADDQTIRELIDEQEDPGGLKGAVQGGIGTAELLAQGFEAAGIGAGLELSAAAGEVFIFGKELVDAEQRGAAVERDATRAGMAVNLDLPQGYKTQVMERLDSKYQQGFQSGAMRMGTAGQSTVEGRQAMQLAQIHADQGANACEKMLTSNMDRATFAKAHPDVAVKYATDPAFRMGFDAMQWAHNAGKAEYDSALSSLHARDARYDAHHVQVRS